MENKIQFFIMLKDLNASARYFENDKDFEPTYEMVEALDDIATELFNMVLDNQLNEK